MAFQTNVYRGGEWRTETIDVNTIVKANKTVPGSKKPRLPRAPQCGLLTRTVVESTLIHFILPVRLRGPQHNDVAFIAVGPVQSHMVNPCPCPSTLPKDLMSDIHVHPGHSAPLPPARVGMAQLSNCDPAGIIDSPLHQSRHCRPQGTCG